MNNSHSASCSVSGANTQRAVAIASHLWVLWTGMLSPEVCPLWGPPSRLMHHRRDARPQAHPRTSLGCHTHTCGSSIRRLSHAQFYTDRQCFNVLIARLTRFSFPDTSTMRVMVESALCHNNHPRSTRLRACRLLNPQHDDDAFRVRFQLTST